MHWACLLAESTVFSWYLFWSNLIKSLKTLHELPSGAYVIYLSIQQRWILELLYFSCRCRSLHTFGIMHICVCSSLVKNLDISGSWYLPLSELCPWRHCSYFSQDIRVRSANTSFVSSFLPHVKHEMFKVAASLVFIYLNVLHMKLSLRTQAALTLGGLMSDLLPSFTSV